MRCLAARVTGAGLGGLRRVAGVLVVGVLAGAVLAGAGPVSALSGGAYLDGAQPWIGSDCAGDVPIVVGSDARAQSDIYSAVTLAGMLATDCVVLAGPRDAAMPASQRARLDAAAAGGYVVGGEAAVPAAKLAGRQMIRIAGADRWQSAQQVGRQARLLAPGAQPGAAVMLDTSLGVPDDVHAAGLYLTGAGPWLASDCAGDTAVVVASDAPSQSDVYSAVTLAGVIGTDCVVLAGARRGDMPASQRRRLGAAAPSGYVVGGTAAVPAAKIAGHSLTRLAGADRWGTAQLVGEHARRIAGGADPAQGAYSDVPASSSHAHSIDRLRRDGVLAGTDCADGRFCPDQPVTGRTFATWLTRILDGRSSPDPIARLVEQDIVTHCADPHLGLCPDGVILRERMAVFFARAFDLDAPNVRSRFVDVETSSFEHESISRLVATTIHPSYGNPGSTGLAPRSSGRTVPDDLGCGYPSRFCPSDAVSRAQMANLLARAIDWESARDDVAVTGSDNSINLTVAYDEEDYEATVSWRKPSSSKGQVDHYVLQSRTILDNFGPGSYRIVEPESSKTSYRIEVSNITNTNYLYAFRVIVVEPSRKRGMGLLGSAASG